MQGKFESGFRRMAMLVEFTEDIVTQGIQVIVLGDNEEVNLEELVLNVAIIDVMDNEKIKSLNCYTKVVHCCACLMFSFNSGLLVFEPMNL